MRRGWRELLRSLGEALLELVKAELGALSEELKGTGRGVAVVLAIVAAAGALAFWACAALTLALVEVASIWLPGWGAALAVAALLVALAALLLLVARWRIGRLETPADTVRRHYEESAAWWSERVLDSGAPRLPAGDEE